MIIFALISIRKLDRDGKADGITCADVSGEE